MNRRNGDAGNCPFCGSPPYTTALYSHHRPPGYKLNSRYILGRALRMDSVSITYIGYDSLLCTRVAVKEYYPSCLSDQLTEGKQILQPPGEMLHSQAGMTRFLNEARLNNKLMPLEGIVQVLDVLEENGRAYIVREYLAGETLADRLKRMKKLTAAQALEILAPLSDTLAGIHRRGLIHRDICPEGILLPESGVPCLIDLGEVCSAANHRYLSVNPGYSPEELYKTDAVWGSFSDVYSLAAVLYTMLTGLVPPSAPDRCFMCQQHKKDPLKPLSPWKTGLSRRQIQALNSALRFDFRERTQTVEDFRRELFDR